MIPILVLGDHIRSGTKANTHDSMEIGLQLSMFFITIGLMTLEMNKQVIDGANLDNLQLDYELGISMR